MTGASAVTIARLCSTISLQRSSIGFDAHDALLSEGFNHVGGEFDRFKETQRHDRHHDVQLEVPGLSAERYCRVTADHMGGHLQHGFTHYRIHLTGHDGGSRLCIRQADLADTAPRPRGKPAQVVGYLGEADRQCF